MQLEFKTEVLVLNEKMSERLAQLQKEGWLLVNGVAPLAVYQLCRQVKQQAEGLATGTLTIDESGVQIIRDGKVVN